MKLLILSDLHLEFAPFETPKTDADVIILAGDTDIGLRVKNLSSFSSNNFLSIRVESWL